MEGRVLISNRGEIAYRIIRTLKKLGLTSIAVYSDADEKSPYTTFADEAYYIGPSNPAKSYLNMEKIIEIAKKAKADAIHPGYGFLSENDRFARMVEDSGLIWVGPNPDVMKKLSSKTECRRIAKEAGIPIVPGTSILQKDTVESELQKIGFPLLLKPDKGGGGKGMKRIYRIEEIKRAYETASNEAFYAFGNSDLYAEKYIEGARHIEIQIIADKSGNVYSIGDRDCSAQRRHQKIIEETPAPRVNQVLREKMYKFAKMFIKASGYDAVGTVEFVVDELGNPYFMEINKRIQVEHPITEETTGLDIVMLQLENAFNGKVSLSQDVYPKGHAIEARIYAEDPDTFFPSPGEITDLYFPQLLNIRVDHSLDIGTKVPPFYDPLIAKAISKGVTREEAINNLVNFLQSVRIAGIKTNIPFLIRILGSDEFRSAKINTTSIDKMVSAHL